MIEIMHATFLQLLLAELAHWKQHLQQACLKRHLERETTTTWLTVSCNAETIVGCQA
jgi:hypothetical protein